MSERKRIAKKFGTKYFFVQLDNDSCGLAATASVLSMYGKRAAPNWDTKKFDGSSPWKINYELRKRGIAACSLFVCFERLRPRTIVYYPVRRNNKQCDHYVAIERVDKQGGKILVNDSTLGGPRWLTRKTFEKKWLWRNMDKGWAMLTNRERRRRKKNREKKK